MRNTNYQNNGTNKVSAPTLISEKRIKPKQRSYHAWLIVPVALIIVAITAVVAIHYNKDSKGFRARNIYMEHTENPPTWNVYGREIYGTESKILCGDRFVIDVDNGDGEGVLEIKVTNTESGEVLLDKTFPNSESCSIQANGERATFEAHTFNFSGHFLIRG